MNILINYKRNIDVFKSFINATNHDTFKLKCIASYLLPEGVKKETGLKLYLITRYIKHNCINTIKYILSQINNNIEKNIFLNTTNFVIKIKNGPTICKKKCLLEIASRLNKLDIVKLLVNNGAIINNEQFNYPVLFHSCMCNNFDMTKYLINNKANMNIFVMGVPLYDWASSRSDVEILKLVMTKRRNTYLENGGALLYKAAKGNKPYNIKYLVDLKIDINSGNDNIIYGAILSGKLDIVKYVVALKANIDVRRNNGTHNNPADDAALYGNLDILKYLVSLKADIHENINNTFPIIHAKGYSDIINFMIKNGVDINSFNNL